MSFKKAEIAGVSLLAAALAVLLYTAVRHDWPAWETPWTIGGALLLAVAGTAVLLAGYRCPYCGKGLKFGARYCTHCGSSLEDCGRIRRDHAPPASAKLPRGHVWAARLRWALSVPVFLALACSPYAAWERLAKDLDHAKLAEMTKEIGLADVFDAGPKILAGQLRGRTVVRIS